jgi:transposase-like protein
MSSTKTRYNLAFKKKVVQEVQVGQESAYSVSLKYKIGGSATVYRWISKLGNPNLTEMNSNNCVPEQNALLPDTTQVTPSISEHSSELEMLRLKVLALETMIDVAEQELGLSIRKKSYAKQSKD